MPPATFRRRRRRRQRRRKNQKGGFLPAIISAIAPMLIRNVVRTIKKAV